MTAATMRIAVIVDAWSVEPVPGVAGATAAHYVARGAGERIEGVLLGHFKHMSKVLTGVRSGHGEVA
jgi:hypothetical protein